MIKRQLNSSLLLLVSVFFFSCAGVKKFRGDLASAKDRDRKNFVQTNDGTIYEVNEVVFRNPLFGKSTVEIDKNTKINAKDILAYQNSTGYYRRVEGMLAPRIKKGLINMYLTTQTYQEFESSASHGGGGHWRTRTRYFYHLQKGDDAPVVRFDPNVLEEYVKDYPAAMEYIEAYKMQMKKVRTWSWVNTGAVVGGIVMVGTAGLDNNNNVTPAGYAGVGLFVGGLVSGVVNKFRRIKPYKNLELAIDEYNSQILKSKKTRK